MQSRKRNFTVDEDIFIKDNYREMFDDEIAQVLDRPVGSITRRRQRLGCWYIQQELSSTLPDEKWVHIKGLPENYQVSNKGRVKSNNKLITLYVRKNGYVQWRLMNLSKGIAKTYKIHRLVAEHFLELPKDFDGYHVHHIDHNPLNNAVENLQWLSRDEHNQVHR